MRSVSASPSFDGVLAECGRSSQRFVFWNRIPSLSTRAIRWRSVALCLLVTGLSSAWSSRADATCGDYLFHDDPADMSPQDPQSPAPVAPAHKPCHGPGCRNQPAQQPIAPSTPTDLTRSTDQLVSIVFRDLHLTRTSSLLAFEIESSSLAGFLPGINRPPARV
jgi:hypothetical protein